MKMPNEEGSGDQETAARQEGSGDQETDPIITVIIAAAPTPSAAPTTAPVPAIAVAPTTAGQPNIDNVDANEGSGRGNLDLESEN